MNVNNIAVFLDSLNLIDKSSIVLLQEGVRDNNKINVFKCNHSGIIFLSGDDHITNEYYSGLKDFEYWGENDIGASRKETYHDDYRRFGFLRNKLKGAVCLDFGAGNGGFMHLAKEVADRVCGVEIQPGALKQLAKEGFEIKSSIDVFEENSFNLITMFHVLEHLKAPLDSLKAVYDKLKPGGHVCIEVPHARDFLLTFLHCDSFKKFTLWGEHLILHTRSSLTRVLDAVGFRDITVFGVQRYPLSNHLYWLTHHQPNGHVYWKHLNDPDFDRAYELRLDQLDMTDTLFAMAKK